VKKITVGLVARFRLTKVVFDPLTWLLAIWLLAGLYCLSCDGLAPLKGNL